MNSEFVLLLGAFVKTIQLEAILQTLGVFQKETNIHSPKCGSYNSTKRAKLDEKLSASNSSLQRYRWRYFDFQDTPLSWKVNMVIKIYDVMVLGSCWHFEV